jgi:FAD:protein FMN transferase
MKIFFASIVLLIAPIAGRSQTVLTKPVYLEGYTMGTTYHIVYFDHAERNFGSAVDSLLALVNQSINTYDAQSEVSEFNRSSDGISYKSPYFYPPIKKALEVYQASDGAFDPTVMPLVNAWGFGSQKSLKPSATQVDSLLKIIGFNKLIVSEMNITKTDARIQLDFGGIGQGYGVDVVADFLRSRGIQHFLVEIGGEGVTSGRNIEKGRKWEIGILDPNSTRENQFFKAYVSLQNRSFTTSGNYFNYREVDGKKYGHTIDPRTGYPVQHELLSASVFADDCSTADAWATAFMVMGLEKAKRKLQHLPGIEALLIYSSSTGQTQTYLTPGLTSSVRMEP